MPYYSLPLGITSEDVGGSYNKEIITGLLRERYKFDGIICTDWKTITDVKLPFGIIFKPASAFGVENLNIKERIIKNRVILLVAFRDNNVFLINKLEDQ